MPPSAFGDQSREPSRHSSDTTEKLARIARIQKQARNVFSTDEAVAGWLNSPAPSLNGAKPIDLLETDLGAREIESILNGIECGNVM
jgi:putative toxin-antitoxin system antitoxin component (TIGR02293 family)